MNMMGKLTPAMTHGTNESILFALANSNAAALWGLRKSDAPGCAGLPGWKEAPVVPLFVTCRRDGERKGEEKERRYRAMKKTSFNAQKRKRTVCGSD
jgi:hypothetical protein